MMSTVFTLLFLGLVFALAELFLPGGICGAISVITLLVASGFIYAEYGFVIGTWCLVAILVVIAIGFYIGIKIFPKTPLGQQVLHTSDASDAHAYDDSLHELIGKTGTALTVLRPSGMALVDGKRRNVVTDGDMIPKDAPIKVIAVQGNRVVVEACQEPKVNLDKQ